MEVMDRVDAPVQEIDTGSRQTADTLNRIAVNMDEFTSISEKRASAAEASSSAIRQQASTMQELTADIQELTGTAQELVDELGRFKLRDGA